MKRVFIGVAWPYANGPLHLGHVAGSLLPPDIFSRYHRMKGNEVLMVSGSDEHGTPITVTADRERCHPSVIAERFHILHKESLEKLGIKFDLFFRTSHPNHKKVVHDIFLTLFNKGYIYKKEMNAFYCEKCNRFLPDRYVIGKCRHCGYEDAKGDQCDNCGKALEFLEIIEPKCRICKSSPVIKKSRHLFFKLSAFEEKLKKYVNDKMHWRPNVINFTMNWLKEGLKDRAITRDLQWGVEIPLDGYEDKRIYVWFEAVIGYLSTSIEWSRLIGKEKEWEKFWKDENCKHYYFLGKDNIPFHTLIWPSMLMGYGGLNLPYDVPANEYLSFGGEKFSKSRGIGVEVLDFLKYFSADSLRYYLSVNMPETHDANFSWKDFIRKNNDELVGILGNFINRVLTFTSRHFKETPKGDRGIEEVRNKIEEVKKEVEESIENCKFKAGMRAIMHLARFGNRYIDVKAPWKLIKEDEEKCGDVLRACLFIVKSLCILMHPYLPFASKRLWNMMGYKNDLEKVSWEEILVPPKHGIKIGKSDILFKKISEKELEKKVENTFELLELKVGEIEYVKDHPNADKLYVLLVNLGREKRTLVAGIKEYYKPEELLKKKIIVLTNLKTEKLRGIESQGMLLAADDDKTVAVLTTDKESANGDFVVGSETLTNTPQKMITYSQFLEVKMVVGRVIDINDKNLKVSVGKNVLNVRGKNVSEGDLVVIINDKEIMMTSTGKKIYVDRKVDDGALVR